MTVAFDRMSLGDAAIQVLSTADARQKATFARAVSREWLCRKLGAIAATEPVPDRPARPDHPVLMLPRDVPRRKINAGVAGRIALLHALAHIELNAIDLAFDMIARFSDQDMPEAFFDDWIAVGDDEARHFLMLEDRLQELGGAYGDLPAHDGLWQAAMETAHDLLARLAIVPMVLEARGLDVTPDMIKRLHAAGDQQSAEALTIIHDDEIGHVAVGKRWFDHVCATRGLTDPVAAWQDLVRKHFKGGLKPPFNTTSRDLAGFPEQYYAVFEA